jgi:uncharacterized protein YfcZ (UPF0381/DUF406 family)
MKPYILEITNLKRMNGKTYLAEISLVDTKDLTVTPYKTIEVEAINQEFAKKIVIIRMEEMLAETTESNLVFGIQKLIATKINYTDEYNRLAIKLDEVRTEQEEMLAEIVEKAQQSESEGIDIKALDTYVELDGEVVLVWAVRVYTDENGTKWVELKATSTGDEDDTEWLSIYDYSPDAAGIVLSAIMDKI